MWSDNISSGKVGRNKLRTQTQKSFFQLWVGTGKVEKFTITVPWPYYNKTITNGISGAEPRELLCNCRSCNPTRGRKRHVNHRTTMLHNKWNYHTNFLQLHLCEIQINQHSTRWNPKWLLNIWNKNYCNLHEINCCTLLTSNPHTHNYTYTLTSTIFTTCSMHAKLCAYPHKYMQVCVPLFHTNWIH